jgi:type I restriction enzyme S subunit
VSAGLKTTALDEVAELNPRFTETLAPDDEVSFVPMSAVSAETAGITDEQTRKYSEVSKGYTPFVTGDVLVAKITPCFENGKIAQARLAHRVGFGSTEFHVVRPRVDKLDARYTLHFLRRGNVRLAGERRMTGSAGQRRVPENFLAKLEIPLPPLAEQRRIAEVLDRAEALRAKRRATLAQLDPLTHSIFINMFGNPATNPKHWPHKTLFELGRIVTGGTPPSAKADMFDGPIPFVTPGDLESDEPVKRSLTVAGAEESKTVRAGATLVCCIGATIGKMGIAPVRSAFNQQLNAVEWSSEVDDIYGYATLRFFKPTIKTWGASTTLPILKKSSFEKIEIPVPPLPLQREFARRFQATERQRAAQIKSLTALNELFDSLQNRAFRGEL